MNPIMLNDYESQIIYLSKGHFVYDNIFDALIKIREKYYLISEDIENRQSYVRTLSDIAYYGIFTICFEKLYGPIFSKEHYRREFFNEILGSRLWMNCDWEDGQIQTLLDYKEFVVKNIINKLMSIISTLKIYEKGDFGELIELVHLEPKDGSILELRKEE